MNSAAAPAVKLGTWWLEGAFLAASLVDQSRAAITGLETCIFKVWLGFLLAWQLLVFCFAEAQPGELNISQNPKQAQMLHCGTWVPCQEVLGRGYGGGVQLDTQSALGHWDGCDLSVSAARRYHGIERSISACSPSPAKWGCPAQNAFPLLWCLMPLQL